jgi:hypothetical protein
VVSQDDPVLRSEFAAGGTPIPKGGRQTEKPPNTAAHSLDRSQRIARGVPKRTTAIDFISRARARLAAGAMPRLHRTSGKAFARADADSNTRHRASSRAERWTSGARLQVQKCSCGRRSRSDFAPRGKAGGTARAAPFACEPLSRSWRCPASPPPALRLGTTLADGARGWTAIRSGDRDPAFLTSVLDAAYDAHYQVSGGGITRIR